MSTPATRPPSGVSRSSRPTGWPRRPTPASVCTPSARSCSVRCVGFAVICFLPGDGLDLAHPRHRRRAPVRPAGRDASSSAVAPRPRRSARWRVSPVRPPPRCRCCAAAGRPTRSSASPSSRTSCTASSARPASCWSARAPASRLKTLLATERRKHERVRPDVPIHEVVCGNGEGEVPLPKLVAPRHQARPQREARRDDRRPQPPQGDRRPARRPSRCPRARSPPA